MNGICLMGLGVVQAARCASNCIGTCGVVPPGGVLCWLGTVDCCEGRIIPGGPRLVLRVLGVASADDSSSSSVTRRGGLDRRGGNMPCR